jgi:Ribbon-helix-helix protein, copG family
MARPTSFRLPDDLLERLDAEARAHDESVSALVVTLLDEGMKGRRFPGIVFRDGPARRRAALLGGPDVWEVVRDLRHTPGRGSQRVATLAEEIDLPPARIRLAADFYAAHPDEVDRLIALDEDAARRARQLIKRREQLLS